MAAPSARWLKRRTGPLAVTETTPGAWLRDSTCVAGMLATMEPLSRDHTKVADPGVPLSRICTR